MKNIIKLLLALLIVPLIINSCNDDDLTDWKDAEAAFKLNDTTLGSSIFYPTMENNPFILTWDNTTNSTGVYSIVVSSSDDFSNKIELGKSQTNNFKTTIGALNMAMLQAGLSPYSSQAVYVRVETGNVFSTTINFNVTPYPIAGPIITSPANGSTITLNSADQTAIATTVTWSDYSEYGIAVKYVVELAKKGSANFVSLGEVTIPNPNPNNVTRSLAISSKDLNTAALNAGASVNVETEFDFKVTAKTAFSTPAIDLESAVSTAKLKPYQVDYPDFFLVGGATAAGWSPENAPKLYKKDNISEIYTYLQPDEGFRFLGQADWNPINYSMDVPGIRDTYRYFKSVSPNVVRFSDNNDENMKITGTAGIYHVIIDADFGVKSLEVKSSAGVWDIPNLYLVGSIQNWQADSAEPFNPIGNGKFEMIRQIPDNAEFKFIGQQSWGDLEWANIKKDNAGNTGYLGPKGDNGNIKFNGGNSFYTITVDLKMGTYKLVKM